VVNSHSM